jgi:hypothetical protein
MRQRQYGKRLRFSRAALSSKGATVVRIVKRKTCHGLETFVFLDGALLSLEEFRAMTPSELATVIVRWYDRQVPEVSTGTILNLAALSLKTYGNLTRLR